MEEKLSMLEGLRALKGFVRKPHWNATKEPKHIPKRNHSISSTQGNTIKILIKEIHDLHISEEDCSDETKDINLTSTMETTGILKGNENSVPFHSVSEFLWDLDAIEGKTDDSEKESLIIEPETKSDNKVSSSFDEYESSDGEDQTENIPNKTVQQWVNHLPLKNQSSKDIPDEKDIKDVTQDIANIVIEDVPVISAKLSREASVQSNSSLDSLLDSRRPDPVEIFLNLGFGGVPGVNMENCRIPRRFLVPSKCKGGDWNEFLRRELIQAQNFECSSLGFRGLSGPSYRRPSAIVANIMEKLRERTIAPPHPRSRFSTVAKRILNEKSVLNKLSPESQSVLSPDSQRFLQNQGKKSPEVPRRRIIFGQKSFAFAHDGEFVEVEPSSVDREPSKEVISINPAPSSVDKEDAKPFPNPDVLLKLRRSSLQKQKKVEEDVDDVYFLVGKTERAADMESAISPKKTGKIPRRFFSSSNLKELEKENDLSEVMRLEVEKEIKTLSENVKNVSNQDLPAILKQIRQLRSKLENSSQGPTEEEKMGAALCGGGEDPQNQGSVLDRVISQASNKDECLLYKLANYKNSGELIEAYNIGGQAEVEKLIKEQFGVLMYADGKGEVIKRAEYLRWKFRDQAQVVLPIEASLSIYDPLAKWEDHEACWQMQYRGSLGETLLHVLIICDSKIHTKLARTLLKCFPKLALDIVEGEEYLGASALHLAIAYSNNELVQDLVDAGANINQRAVGSFFLPKDQQRAKPSRTTDYEGLAYLGEYPLAWAACCSNESVYNLLLDVGADPDSRDSFGNMILHMVVVCDKLDMFGYALRHPKVPASNGIINNEGLTPLTLACKLGRADVFKEMLELSAKEFWRYSNITCSAYPLNALDTLLPDGRTNWNSAIFIILNGTKEEHLDMLDGGIIQRLLEEKWKTFARGQFMKRLAILFLHIFFLSGSVYLRSDDRDIPLLSGREIQDIVRYCFEIATIIGVLCYLCFQQGDEIRNQGLISFLKQLPHDPAKFIFLISNLLILACIPYRFAGDIQTEEAILVFAVPGSWFLLMFFAGAIRLTGPFVTMIYSMITGDMLTFGIIYTVVLFGFSQSFYFLYKGSKNVSSSLYTSYPSTWMALFQVTMGDYNYNDLSLTAYPAISKMVFTIFMVLVPILLLNMLIAMMGNTYAHVIEQSEKEWMKQWAKIVVALERAVNQQDCHQYLQEYSIKLGSGDDPSTEQRGVMVIKSKSKTRAKQRKGALCNWKRVGKVTIRELHKRGMTGEQLRRLMWGRASISTPVKTIPIKLGDVTDLTAPGEPPPSDSMGGGLLAALDVMAFANDIEFKNTPEGQNPPVPKPVITNVTSNEKELVSEFTQDPLRSLVIIAEEQDKQIGNHSQQEIIALARVAANNDNLEEIPPRIFQYGWVNSFNFMDSSIINERGVKDGKHPDFAHTPDPSDSDGFGDGLLLGKSGRLKRARSANQKRKQLNDSLEKNLLMQEDSSSTQSDDFNLLKSNFGSDHYKGDSNLAAKIIGRAGSAGSQMFKFDKKVGRKPRLKTAQNKVVPAEVTGNAKPENGNNMSSSSEMLGQWSTKDIANMNTLLGWDNDDSM